MLTAARTLLDTGTWDVDADRSFLGFAIRHLRVATVRGRFTAFSGTLTGTGDGVRIDGHVRTDSVDTGDAVRDERLRTEFFESDAFPLIEFGARCTAPAPGEDWLVAGTLTIRGTARPVMLQAVAEPLGDDAVHVVLSGAFRRSQFGLDWDALRQAGRLLVGDTVHVSADIVLRPSQAAG